MSSATRQTLPAIDGINDNRADYPGGKIPKYEKLEITFRVHTVAQNLQLPYDASPPPGVTPGVGISVDALFTPDGWRTIYPQPAFYYQQFEVQTKGKQEWYYPTANFSWKVRFAPNEVGEWQYKLVARDASGVVATPPRSFTVVPSESHGFVRVGKNDPRYFEFDDGTYFPALGYNMNYRHVDWVNPVLGNQENFDRMAQNGIQYVRIWLSQWAIYGSAWNPWKSIQFIEPVPPTGLTSAAFGDEVYPGSEVSLKVGQENKCMFIGNWESAAPALKRHTTYRVRIRYKTTGIDPRKVIVPGKPFGFVAKVGGWLWDEQETGRCDYPGTGTPVTPYQAQNTPDWQILEGKINSAENDFLPNFYLAMENVREGQAFVDYVWIEEELGAGQYGPNVVSKPWMAHHLYFDQRNSFAFDRLLDLAKQYHIYLRPVILEKNDWIFNHINDQGAFTTTPDNNWFYGHWRTMTKTRWLQQAWWRYLQARWGYSTHIHSWELLNEGDPFNGLHWALADELGRYMHQFGPDSHLVSTSFWHSFPLHSFWCNPEYPNLDFADVHLYFEPQESHLRVDDADIKVAEAEDYYDTAALTQKISLLIGAKQVYGPRKPVVRGESGFRDDVLRDTRGIWLHNFVWGGINPGGLIDSGNWYPATHIYSQRSDGTYAFDHRLEYGNYYRFIEDVPLSNGQYQDAEVKVTHPDLRVWGQKDLVHGRAHFWIQNKHHTWRNVIDHVAITPISASLTISGFQSGQRYALEWWDTYSGVAVGRPEILTADVAGNLQFFVQDLTTDVAAKIEPLDGLSMKAPLIWGEWLAKSLAGRY